jgi:hypothetical protein
MASAVYNKGKYALVSGDVDWLTTTIKVMLVDDTYTFSATHNFVSDVSADELSGTGYVAGFGNSGRKTLGSKTVTEDDANNRAELDAGDLTWTGLDAGTVGGAIVIVEITNDAASLLLAFLDSTDTASNGGDFTFQWDAEGIIQIG